MAPLIDVSLPADLDEVWAHLREPVRIARWFGWEYDGLTHEIELLFLQEARVDEDARSVTWDHGDRIVLEPAPGGTRMLLHHPPAPAEDDGYDDLAEGWIAFAQQLRFALERHPGQDRRTVRLQAPEGAALAAPVELGEPWHETPHQIGRVVDDGLLVVTTTKPSLTYSAFGRPVDPARWEAWWTDILAP